MAFKPDFITELPAPLQAPAGDLFESGRDYVEEKLKNKLGIGKPSQFSFESLPTQYVDPNLPAASRQQLLYIQHLASKKSIGFFAMLKNLSHNYSINWNPEQVYGRPDPIPGYANTTKNISVSFTLISANLDEAKYNYNKTIGRGGLERVSLTNMLYPTYKDINGYKTIASPPIVAIKHMQLIQSYGSVVDGGYLVGYIGSANIVPKFDNGGYEDGSGKEPETSSPSFIYPKEIDISFDFTVLHDYDLGWKASTGFLAELFPELGSGEDIARIIGGRSFGGAKGAALGSILGGAGDDITNDLIVNENQVSNDGVTAGDARSSGMSPILANAGIKALLGSKQ